MTTEHLSCAPAVHPDGAVVDLDPYVNPYEGVLQEAMAALAREYALRLPLDAAVLAMTDGFYRLADHLDGASRLFQKDRT